MPLVLAVVVAGLAAASLRLQSLTSTLLAFYVALVAELGVVTWLLSPFDAVTMTGLLGMEAVLLVAAAAVWWLRGRPGVSTVAARATLREVADPVTLALLAVAGIALAYELLLVLTTAPTNWDSLTYHLSRVAAWHQAHGIHWIANAPTGRMNEFQPLAEQQILFLFVATGSTALFALPQFVAELACVVAVYGTARRLGYGARASARAAGVLATLALIALESTTAQNDLVAAAFPVIGAYFLLEGGTTQIALAGFAIALGAGVKLTSLLTVPVLLWLAWLRGRRTWKPLAAGCALGVLAVSAWGYVLNLAHTGHVLGHGQGRVENEHPVTVTNTIDTAAHFVYRLIDLGPLPTWLVIAFAVAAAIAAGAAVLLWRRPAGALVALPLLAPIVVLALLHGIPRQDPADVQRSSNEDFSAFGPIGTLLLFGAPTLVLATERGDRRRVALALALPTYIVLLALNAKYNIWTPRFLVVPVVLTAPLFAAMLRGRFFAAAIAVVAAVSVGYTLIGDGTKRLRDPVGRPWTLDQAQALVDFPAKPTGRIIARSLTAYDSAVPRDACVGAVLGPDEPAYLLWGSHLRRQVHFLPSLAALQTAIRENLGYVVISTGANRPVADQFSGARWHVRPLGSYWLLATPPASYNGPVCGTVG